MRQQFPRQITALDEIFALLRNFGVEHGLDTAAQLELGVIVEELFTNQVRHARGGGSHIEIALGVDGDMIRLEISDENVEPFDPGSAQEVDISRPAEERTPGGLGIHFVRQMCDSFTWDYDPDRRLSRITITRQLER